MHIYKINERKMFGINMNYQLANMIPEQVYQWTVIEGALKHFFHPMITLVKIKNFCQVHLEVHVINM